MPWSCIARLQYTLASMPDETPLGEFLKSGSSLAEVLNAAGWTAEEAAGWKQWTNGRGKSSKMDFDWPWNGGGLRQTEYKIV